MRCDFVVAGVEEGQLAVAPVTQLEQGVFTHGLACMLMVEADLQQICQHSLRIEQLITCETVNRIDQMVL